MSVLTPELGRSRGATPSVAEPVASAAPAKSTPVEAPVSGREENNLFPLFMSGDKFNDLSPAVLTTTDETSRGLLALQKSSMANLGWEAGRVGETLERLKRPTRFTPSMGLRQVAAPLLPMFNSALDRVMAANGNPPGGGVIDIAGTAVRAFELIELEHDFPISSLRKVELLELAAREGTFGSALLDTKASKAWGEGLEVSQSIADSVSQWISKEELLKATSRPPSGVPEGLWGYATAFYDGVQMAAIPREIAKQDPLKGTDFDDGPWYVDHGPDHHRNVVEQIAPTLKATLTSGLIPARDRPERVAFMESLGQMVAAIHDVWMVDCTSEGKREHAWRVGREAFTDDPRFTREVDLLVQGDFGKALREVYGVEQKDLPITVRELLSLGIAHSKSSVGLAPLEDPSAFRSLAQSNLLREDPAGYGVLPNTCISHYGSASGLRENSYRWLEQNPALAADAVDVCRVVRTADGLRWRGIDYRGHLGGQIALVAKGREPHNLFRLTDPETGTTYVVRYNDGPHMGETNARLAEVVNDGSIHLGIRSGGGGDEGSPELARRTADGFFVSIWREFAGSFADAANRPIVIEAPDEPNGVAFAQTVADEMLGSADRSLEEARAKWEKASGDKKTGALEKVQAAETERNIIAGLQARGLIRVAPARPPAPGAAEARDAATRLEAERFAAAPTIEFSKAELQSLKQLVHRGGADTAPMHFDRALEGAKRIRLSQGEVLMARGGKSDFVYIPLASDAFEVGQARGHPALPVLRGVPVGELDAAAEQPREADWVALEDTELLAIPAETYRREWAPHFYTRDVKDEAGQLKEAGSILRRLRTDYGADGDAPTAAAA